MTKKLPLLVFICGLSLLLPAQWDSSGTQISFLHNASSHRPFTSAAAQGGYYAVWQSTDTPVTTGISSVWLNAFDNTGAVITGWPIGGVKISDTSNNYAPQLLTSEDGNVIVAWCSFPHGASTNGNIYVQKYSTAGLALWNGGEPLQLNPDTPSVNEYPVICTDKHKGVFVTWNRFDVNIDPSSDQVFLQHVDSTGRVATGWNTAPLGVATLPGVRQYYPSIAITPDGQSVYVVYDTGLVPASSIIVNRYYASNGSLGSNWSTAGYTVSPGPYVYQLLNATKNVFTDSSDDVIILWIEDRHTANGELYMQTLDTTGNMLLQNRGKLLYGDLGAGGGTGNGIDYLETVQDSDQNLLVCYGNLVNDNDVGAMRVSPLGDIIWSDTLVTTDGYSAYPNPVGDGKRGMFIFYNRSVGSNENLYAIELDSTGKHDSTWTVPGVNFGNLVTYDAFDPEYDFNPLVTRRSEAVVAWANADTSGLLQIFTCNLLSDKQKCTTDTAYRDTIPAGIKITDAENLQVRVFPNPCGQSANIYVASSNNEELVLSVYDPAGREILQQSLTGFADNLVNTALLAQGLYLYTIGSKDNVVMATGRLVKE